jgi:hypothetical protein
LNNFGGIQKILSRFFSWRLHSNMLWSLAEAQGGGRSCAAPLSEALVPDWLKTYQLSSDPRNEKRGRSSIQVINRASIDRGSDGPEERASMRKKPDLMGVRQFIAHRSGSLLFCASSKLNSQCDLIL